MNICQNHWDRLRCAIEARGLMPLVHKSGEAAAEATARELRGEATPRDYDPLMAAFWSIGGNAGQYIARVGGNPLYLLVEGPEDVVTSSLVERARDRGVSVPDGVTWPKCSICYLNLAHKLTCDDAGCKSPLEGVADWMIERAADDQLAKAMKLGLVPGRQ